MCLVDGDLLRIGSYRGQFAQEVEQAFPRPLAGTLSDMAIRQGSVLYLPSVLAADGLPSYIVDVAQKRGDYSVVNAPMTWDGRGIGTIDIICKPPRAFSEAELGLVKTFADQAVIAIQNARLFNETQEALAHQTASADILRVISSSPTDVQPVFDAIVATAVKHLGCDLAIVQICSGDTYSPKAMATLDGLMPVPGSTVMPIDPNANFPSRAIVSKSMLHLRDWSAIKLPAHEQARHEQLGLNSALYLPLLRGDACLGVLVLGNKRANGFNDKAVALAESFRDQAVIAIENVRLFNETREALERQTATADVLQVIGSSMSDPTPVFEKIVERCEGLFDALAFGLAIVDDGGQVHLPVYRRTRRVRAELGDAASAAIEAQTRAAFPRPLAGTLTERAIRAGALVEIREAHDDSDRVQPAAISALQMGPGTSVVVAPLMWEGRGVGSLTMLRRATARRLEDKENALLRSFADQAVIAIQNARLFNETREALERQTTTAEILKVISSSPTDTQPVFDAIVRSAARLFGRKAALRTVDADGLRRRAKSYLSQDEFHGDEVLPVDRGNLAGRAVLECRALQIADTQAPDATPYARQNADRLAFRAAASAPLVHDGVAIGVISVSSPEPGALSDSQMALLSTFADQAVIAIQNARLFNETREALERQTATADVLKVISESRKDVQPVVEVIAERAARLTGADYGCGVPLRRRADPRAERVRAMPRASRPRARRSRCRPAGGSAVARAGARRGGTSTSATSAATSTTSTRSPRSPSSRATAAS